MPNFNLNEIETALRACWCRETAWTPDQWSADNPAAGQCWSSAYTVRALLGGEVVHAEVLPESTPRQWHAWNRLPDGTEIDFTREQFPAGQQFSDSDFPEDRIQAFVGAQAELLLEKVRQRLGASAY
jgi:hypothetical protein